MNLDIKISLYLILFAIILCVFILVQNIYYHSYWQRKGVSFLKPTFIMGEAWPLFLRKRNLGETLEDVYKKAKKINSDFVGFYVLNKACFIPRDPELIKTILVKDYEYFSDRGLYYNKDVDPFSTNLVGLIFFNIAI